LFEVRKLVLTEDQKVLLKKPLGELVSGTISECNEKLRKVKDADKPVCLILVGDTISRNAIQSGIRPDVVIIDHKEKREEAEDFSHGKTRIFTVVNEASTISLLAWQAVAEAVEKGDSTVIIKGEEDLLTLVAILVAPVGSVVAYGQPGTGIVLVRVTPGKKTEIQLQIDSMRAAD
jgi:uncharacterized protein (UPF0218 family)